MERIRFRRRFLSGEIPKPLQNFFFTLTSTAQNGRLRSAELLLKENGDVKLIRRAETMADYFATFDCFGEFKMLSDGTADRRMEENP